MPNGLHYVITQLLTVMTYITAEGLDRMILLEYCRLLGIWPSASWLTNFAASVQMFGRNKFNEMLVKSRLALGTHLKALCHREVKDSTRLVIIAYGRCAFPV